MNTNKNTTETNVPTSDTLSRVISNNNFAVLEKNLQGKIVDNIQKEKLAEGGFIGKFVGISLGNASINVAFLICLLLILLLAIDFGCSFIPGNTFNFELLNAFAPIISLSLGYIFGRNAR
jgi:hypothetical protein